MVICRYVIFDYHLLSNKQPAGPPRADARVYYPRIALSGRIIYYCPLFINYLNTKERFKILNFAASRLCAFALFF
jgi:hypothetical protein